MGWVAFLRAINLGARNKIAMADLRAAFENAGCSDVRTYIQSGNVLFQASGSGAALRRKLERAVERECGVKTAIAIRTWTELRRIAGSHPFGADTSGSAVTFLVEKPAAAAVRRLRELEVAPDEAKVVGKNVFIHYPNGVQGSRLTGALVEKTLGVAGTNRGWRTVARLAELTSSEARR
jgi:uncharacterized protein (DUF1697 family)